MEILIVSTLMRVSIGWLSLSNVKTNENRLRTISIARMLFQLLSDSETEGLRILGPLYSK
jgi:hypothetical protein